MLGWFGDSGGRESVRDGENCFRLLALRPYRNAASSDASVEDSVDGFNASLSVRDFFFRLLSVTTHSTSSRRQLVHGDPFSITSQRTFLARQQQQALEARLFTGRDVPDKPAAAAFLLLCGWDSEASFEAIVKPNDIH